MGNGLTRRAALAGLMGTLAAPALATAPLVSLRPVPRPGSLPPPAATEIVSRAKLGGVTAFHVAHTDGTPLEALHADIPVPPASVAKAVTALYALDALGSDYRFATALLGTGPVEGGVLQGDLILRGTGDPIFDTDALGGLAAQLREAGVTGITGGLYVDDRALPTIREIDEGQPRQAGYNPSVSGLNLNYNRVHFEWRRTGEGYRLTMDARAKTYQPRVASTKMRAVAEPWPIYTHSVSERSESWTVARPALGSSGARWLPVRLPGVYAGDVFRTIAASLGVTLPAAQPETMALRGAVLASHVSPSLRGLCGGMLKYSTNLTAEVLGLRASQAHGAAPEDLAASAARMNAWVAERHGVEMALVDHSGLGDASRVAPEALTTMLRNADWLAPILKTIKVKNDRGDVVSSPAYEIRAKTGTLNFVNALSGFIQPREGAPLAFAILSADMARRAAIPTSQGERPDGARSYARRARLMQQRLIARWAAMAEKEA